MYCMCACFQKQPHSKQNGVNYTTNITNGQAKMSNGISNPTFVHTETNGNEMKEKITKKKALAPPPPVVDQKENIEVQQEAVIAQLDEILDKEVAIAQLDDVLNDETCRITDRKVSAGTLSNMSAVTSRFEDVVADVHRANVTTPIANPKSLPNPIVVCDNPIVPINDSDKSVEILKEDNESLGKSEVEKQPPNASEEKNESELGKVSQPGDATLLVNLSTESSNSNDTELQHIDDNTNNVVNDQPSESNDMALVLSELENKSASNDDDDVSKNSPKEIPPVFSFSKDDVTDNSRKPLPSVSFDESAKAQDETPVSSPFPTKEALKSVTLRHVKKQIKQIENDDNINASEDNLKVGSEEYKNFIKSLDNKLKRSTVIPSLYPLPKKDIIVKPKEITPNENVVEENINQTDAKEKLKHFIESSLLAESEQRRESKLDSPRRLLRDENRSKSVDDTLIDRNLEKKETVLEQIEASNNVTKEAEEIKQKNPPNELDKGLASALDHKLKMENVFHSIRLRKPDPISDDHLKRRLSKSLGRVSAKEEDQSDHKLKMEDIFKDIKALKKTGTSGDKLE